MPLTAHDPLRSPENLEVGSNRAFGLIISIAFIIIGLWPLINENPIRTSLLYIALVLIIFSIFKPDFLKPLNRLWFLFGLILHKIFNPIIMGLLFYLTITPTGLLMRLFKKRPLNLSFDNSLESYWIQRSPPGPKSETMKNQF